MERVVFKSFKWNKESKTIDLFIDDDEVKEKSPTLSIPTYVFDQVVEKVYGVKVIEE